MRLNGDWTLNEALLQHLENEFSVDVSGERLMDPYGDGEQITEDGCVSRRQSMQLSLPPAGGDRRGNGRASSATSTSML